MFNVRLFEVKIIMFEFDCKKTNSFEFVHCSIKDVRVLLDGH